MPVELKLPDVGEGVAEGEIVRWLVAEGDAVQEDQLLVEVLTDKADVEIPSPVSGVLARILAKPGQVVKVGEILALIEPAGSQAATGAAQAPAAAFPAGGPPAAPAVRKLAKDLGVDLASVRGTGPGGRVTEEDVRAATRARSGIPGEAGPSFPARGGAPPPPGAHPLEERVPFRGKRRMAAGKMVRSKSSVPHALLVDEADAGELLSMRDMLREIAAREGVRITILPFIVQAVVTALRAHPAMNASLDEERQQIVIKKHYDIGIAVDADDGLVVPVIRNAGDRTIIELAREIERLSSAVREGGVDPADVGGSTFTVTSIGSIGGLFSYPVINVPEAGILGVHKIVKRPVVREGEIVARDMMYLSLSFDHRIVDGGTATRFMNEVIRRIEAPPEP